MPWFSATIRATCLSTQSDRVCLIFSWTFASLLRALGWFAYLLVLRVSSCCAFFSLRSSLRKNFGESMTLPPPQHREGLEPEVDPGLGVLIGDRLGQRCAVVDRDDERGVVLAAGGLDDRDRAERG